LAAYERGDYEAALKEWRPLAEKGDAFLQFIIGRMYRVGEGVTQDYDEAAKWYRLAAEQGDAKAQIELGFMYENGQGFPQDYAEAVKWYRKAAEQDVARAQHNLGLMYGNGACGLSWEGSGRNYHGSANTFGSPNNDICVYMRLIYSTLES